MTMIAAVGLESGSLLEFDYNSAGAVSTAQKRTGTYSLFFNTTATTRKTITASGEVYIQFGFFPTNNTVSVHFFKWKKGTTVLGDLYFDSASKCLKFYTGDGSTLVATGTTALQNNTWYVVELHIKIDDSGTLECRLNGLSEMSFSGDTKPGADADLDTFDFYSNGSSFAFHIDDLIINNTAGSVNNSWPNGAKIVLLKPAGAGNSTQFTPSSGSNYQTVDELPPVMTDYNYINSDGQLDLFTLDDLPAEAGTINAVQINAFALKTGTPAVNNLKLAYRSDGSTYVSTNKALSTSMALVSQILETNEKTGVAFTVSDLNALEGGYQSAT